MKKKYVEVFRDGLKQYKTHINLIDYFSKDSENIFNKEYNYNEGGFNRQENVNIFRDANNSTIIVQQTKYYGLGKYLSGGILVKLIYNENSGLEKIFGEINDIINKKEAQLNN